MSHTNWEKRLCAHCRKPNHAHRDDDYNDAGDCLAGAELPSRPAYAVVIDGDSEGVRAVKQAFAEMRAAENEDGE